MFSLLSTIANIGFYIGTATVIAAGGFTYLTKPSNDSLGTQLSQNGPMGIQTLGKIVINNTATIDDYVFFKIAKINNKNIAIGAVHHWFTDNKY